MEENGFILRPAFEEPHTWGNALLVIGFIEKVEPLQIPPVLIVCDPLDPSAEFGVFIPDGIAEETIRKVLEPRWGKLLEISNKLYEEE